MAAYQEQWSQEEHLIKDQTNIFGLVRLFSSFSRKTGILVEGNICL